MPLPVMGDIREDLELEGLLREYVRERESVTIMEISENVALMSRFGDDMRRTIKILKRFGYKQDIFNNRFIYNDDLVERNIQARLGRHYRQMVWQALHTTRQSRATARSRKQVADGHLGCTASEFKQYLEMLMEEGMTWGNYGTDWHIGHIIGVKEFDLTDEVQVRLCFNFTNMRPQWMYENLSGRKRLR